MKPEHAVALLLLPFLLLIPLFVVGVIIGLLL